jgi:hypothetical protein
LANRLLPNQSLLEACSRRRAPNLLR